MMVEAQGAVLSEPQSAQFSDELWEAGLWRRNDSPSVSVTSTCGMLRRSITTCLKPALWPLQLLSHGSVPPDTILHDAKVGYVGVGEPLLLCMTPSAIPANSDIATAALLKSARTELNMMHWERSRLKRELRGMRILVDIMNKQVPTQKGVVEDTPAQLPDYSRLEEILSTVKGLRAENANLTRELSDLELVARRLRGDKDPHVGQPQAVASGRDYYVRGKIQRMPRDGSCLFHSLVAGLGRQTSAGRLREEICDFIEVNPDALLGGKPLSDWLQWEVGMDHKDYATQMRSSGEWGGAIEMAICAALYTVHVHVYQEVSAGQFQRICTFDDVGDRSSHVVSVCMSPGHYDAMHVHSQ